MELRFFNFLFFWACEEKRVEARAESVCGRVWKGRGEGIKKRRRDEYATIKSGKVHAFCLTKKS